MTPTEKLVEAEDRKLMIEMIDWWIYCANNDTSGSWTSLENLQNIPRAQAIKERIRTLEATPAASDTPTPAPQLTLDAALRECDREGAKAMGWADAGGLCGAADRVLRGASPMLGGYCTAVLAHARRIYREGRCDALAVYQAVRE